MIHLVDTDAVVVIQVFARLASDVTSVPVAPVFGHPKDSYQSRSTQQLRIVGLSQGQTKFGLAHVLFHVNVDDDDANW